MAWPTSFCVWPARRSHWNLRLARLALSPFSRQQSHWQPALRLLRRSRMLSVPLPSAPGSILPVLLRRAWLGKRSRRWTYRDSIPRNAPARMKASVFRLRASQFSYAMLFSWVWAYCFTGSNMWLGFPAGGFRRVEPPIRSPSEPFQERWICRGFLSDCGSFRFVQPQYGNGNWAVNSRTRWRTFWAVSTFLMSSRTSEIMSAIAAISGSFMPLAVTAGLPKRTPLA